MAKTVKRSPSSKRAAEKVARYRKRLRAAGMRPVQLWLPDTERPGFAAECRRQSRAVRDRGERAQMRWLDAVRDVDGWTE